MRNGTIMGFKEKFQRLLGPWIHPPGKPYTPAPPSPQSHGTTAQSQIPGSPTGSNGAYTEMQADLQPIDGSTIQFGTETIILVDANGRAQDLTRSHNHVLSSGKLVSKIEDVAGVCKICQIAAMEQFQAGELTLEAAQLASLYDVASAAVCEVCGIQGCIRHIRPIETEAGITSMCTPCQKELKKQLRRQKIIQFFLAPISETEDGQEQ